MARIEIRWQDQTGESHTAAARIEDKSDTGVCIRVKESIPAGVKVQVKWHGGEFSATVMNCRPAAGTHAALILQNVSMSRWQLVSQATPIGRWGEGE